MWISCEFMWILCETVNFTLQFTALSAVSHDLYMNLCFLFFPYIILFPYTDHKGCCLVAPFIPDTIGGIMYNTRAVGHSSIHSWSRCNCALSKKPSWWETVESFSVGKFGTKTTSSLRKNHHGTSNRNVHISNPLLNFRWSKSFQAWDILFLCMKLADVFDFELNEM